MAGEFKIKTGLLLGASPTQAVTSITNSSTFTADASNQLPTVGATYGFVDKRTIPIDASINRIDASLNDAIDLEGIFLKEASLGDGFSWNNGYLDVSVSGSDGIFIPNSSVGTSDSHTVYFENGYLESSTGVYVPYTGATGAVTLGANTLSTTSGLITPKIYPSADSSTAFQINKADGTTNVLNVDTINGNVGIGTTSPSYPLDVIGAVKANQIVATGTGTHPSIANGYVELYMYNNGGNYVGRVFAYTGSTYKDLAIGDWNGGNPNIMLKVGGNVGINYGNPDAKLSVKTTGTTDILNLFETGGTEVFTILESGNVGIGTTSPSELLSLGTAGTTAGTLSLAGATSGKAIIQVDASAGTPTLTLPTTTGTLALTSDVISLWDVSTDTTTVYLKDPSDNLQLSSIEFQEDGGTLLFTNMPISSPASSEQSYDMRIDGSSALKIYGMGSGSALSETAVVMNANYFSMGDPNTDGSWRFKVDASGLEIEKKVSGVWVNKGNYN